MSMSGVDEVMRALNEAVSKIEKATYRGLVLTAMEIKADSQKMTPLVTSNLRNSAFIATFDRIYDNPLFKGNDANKAAQEHTLKSTTYRNLAALENCVYIGYTASYAYYAHENPRSGKTEGISPSGIIYKPGTFSTVGQYKFLSYSILLNWQKYIAIMRATVGEV